MKRAFTFASPIGTTSVALSGSTFQLPIYPGILKHPRPDDLCRLLQDPAVSRKYTIEALRVCAWPVLRTFPREWLLYHLPDAPVRPERRRALEYLLG
jgi:hypothetical protein